MRPLHTEITTTGDAAVAREDDRKVAEEEGIVAAATVTIADGDDTPIIASIDIGEAPYQYTVGKSHGGCGC